jgi:hypothetical protein
MALPRNSASPNSLCGVGSDEPRLWLDLDRLPREWDALGLVEFVHVTDCGGGSADLAQRAGKSAAYCCACDSFGGLDGVGSGRLLLWLDLDRLPREWDALGLVEFIHVTDYAGGSAELDQTTETWAYCRACDSFGCLDGAGSGRLLLWLDLDRLPKEWDALELAHIALASFHLVSIDESV